MAPVVFAATPATALHDCYCATSLGVEKKTEAITPETCLALCKKNGQSMAAFVTNAANAPDRSGYCYTEEQCTKQNGILDEKQAWDCVKGQRYCYPDPKKSAKVTLNVSIPNPADPSKPLTLTGNIADYINAMFSFMINAGIVIAIVMTMIGGLQYTLGATTKDGVSKGKDRIKNGVTGLVLLLCVTLIAQTINPYLIRMQLPKFPMIKPIGLPEGASSCEQYIAKKDKNGKNLYKMETPWDGKGDACGNSSTVVAAEGQPEVSAGISCDYNKCADLSKGCLGSGKNAKCLSCVDVVEDNPTNIVPSSSVCSQLSTESDAATISIPGSEVSSAKTGETKEMTKQVKDYYRCGWTKDKDVNNGVVKLGSSGSCAKITINCKNIKKCEDYDYVNVSNSVYPGPGADLEDVIQENNAICAVGGGCGDFGLQTICKENPCGLNAGGIVPTTCVYSSSGTVASLGIPKDDCKTTTNTKD
ncbi:MAG: pilin [Candidatus Uhrbacteria bacterium]|nr:pilin [Candidatus Uhrbacteria bacterium]